jgi:hypothetical protein
LILAKNPKTDIILDLSQMINKILHLIFFLSVLLHLILAKRLRIATTLDLVFFVDDITLDLSQQLKISVTVVIFISDITLDLSQKIKQILHFIFF